MAERAFSMDSTSGMDAIARALATEQSNDGLMQDFAARLFPKSEAVLSDRLLSNSRLALHKLVGGLENEICQFAVNKFGITNEVLTKIAGGTVSRSFHQLERAGILRDAEILDQVFVFAQKLELQARLLQQFSQNDLESALTRNLDHPDKSIVEAAMNFLVALNRRGSRIELHHSELPAEALHDLTWKIIASLEHIAGSMGGQLHQVAEEILTKHDEGQTVLNSALRLANLLEQSETDNEEAPHPLRDGLDLSLARLSIRSGISTDQIVRMTAEPDLARFVIAMRSIDLPAEAALSIHATIDGTGGLLTAASYREIDPDVAKDLVKKWSKNNSYRNASSRLNNGTHLG